MVPFLVFWRSVVTQLVEFVPGRVDGVVVTSAGVIYGAAGLTNNGDHDGSILSVPLAGGTPTPLATGIPTAWRGGITSDGKTVFWADTDGVHSVATTGGPVRTITTLKVLMASRVGDALLLDDNDGGNILSVPAMGGPVTTLAAGQNNPVDAQSCGGDNICWSNEGDLTERGSLSGQGAAIVERSPSGQLSDLLTPGVRSGTLLFDGKSLFSMTGDCCGGRIMRIPLDGSSPAVKVVTTLPGPIAVDDQSVYFGEPSSGVFSVDKEASDAG
jgi:hypothetical protein